MKIDLYCLLYNEEKIVPFVIPYWRRLKEQGYLNRIFVYNNESTDASLEMINRVAEELNITVIDFSTNDTFDDETNMNLKNEIWKQSRNSGVDYVYVSDFDEVLFIQDDANIDSFKEDLIQTSWYNLVGYSFPELEDENDFVHETQDLRAIRTFNDKVLMFKPDVIDAINFCPGAHHCRPVTKDRRSGVIQKGDNEIITLHLCDKLSLDYCIKKYRRNLKRLSAKNKMYGYGIHYSFSAERCYKEYCNAVSASEPLTELLKKRP